MDLDAPLPAQSVRFLEARLSVVSARLRASRTRPLDRDVIEELTELKFNETRLLRRLRLTSRATTRPDTSFARKSAPHDVLLLDPTRELVTELNDACAEAMRRGVLISLALRELDKVSRKMTFIDSIASLVEDGIDAGANHLSLETRLVTGNVVLRLTTDRGLDDTSLGVSALAEAHSVEVEQTTAGLTRISIGACVMQTSTPLLTDVLGFDRGFKNGSAPRPSSI